MYESKIAVQIYIHTHTKYSVVWIGACDPGFHALSEDRKRV